MSKQQILGIDAGGTFTDFVLIEITDSTKITIYKTPSTPDAPERAILSGIRAMGLENLAKSGGLHIIHGSTVATNAVLEGKLARTAFVTNYGFADLLTLARQTRPSLYDLEFAPRPPPVAAELCIETGGRLDAQGEEISPLTEAELEALTSKIKALSPQAVAINLLFSFLDETSEKRIEAALSHSMPTLFVSRSSRVLPEYREYERGIATWLNAALGPVVSGYLQRLRQQLGKSALQIMQSSGETIAAAKAADAAVNLLLSGPAGGLKAVQFIGEQIGIPKIISFDMGGTSTDVALLDGAIGRTSEGNLAHYPIAVPMVDMHTIGAGGGSIASIDDGGMLQVGPRSAGANPGPACYGHGGVEPTVTDANLVLGRIVASTALAGELTLDRDAAISAVAKLAQQTKLSVEATALGIVAVANEHMAKAIRLISVNRGYDPNEFVLASFGGAGGLHVCALAEAMQMRRAIVPVHCGVLSALGMVVANPGRQFSRTIGLDCSVIDPAQLREQFSLLQASAEAELVEEGLSADQLSTECSVDMRYVGQSYTLNLPFISLPESISKFHALHLLRYGYELTGPTEIVNLRVQVLAAGISFALPPASTGHCNKLEFTEVYGHKDPAPVIARSGLNPGDTVSGPAIISEYSATTYLAPGWAAAVDGFGNLLLDRVG